MLRIIIAIISLTIGYGNEYTIKAGEITYYGYHFLHDWQGKSSQINGNFTFDSSLENFNGFISIPVRSFDSGNTNRDSNMLVYCRGIKFPNIIFRPKKIIREDRLVTINGMLEFAGEVQDLTTNVNIKATSDSSFLAEGKFDIFLSKFDIDRPSLLFAKIDDRISIEFVIIGGEKWIDVTF